MPICVKCLVDKPVDRFYRRSGTAGGHRADCKECFLARPRSPSTWSEADVAFRKARMEYRQRMASEAVGSRCLFCADQRVGVGGLVLHRKDGATHRSFAHMNADEFEREIHSGEYVRLCSRCHKAVHWAMDHLRFTWDDIIRHHETIADA